MLSADGVYWTLFAVVGLLGAAYIWFSRETPRTAMAAPAVKPAAKPKPVPVDMKIAGADISCCRRAASAAAIQGLIDKLRLNIGLTLSRY